MDVTEIGRRGGQARAANLTDKELVESARTASKARWEQYYKDHPEKLEARKERGAFRSNPCSPARSYMTNPLNWSQLRRESLRKIIVCFGKQQNNIAVLCQADGNSVWQSEDIPVQQRVYVVPVQSND